MISPTVCCKVCSKNEYTFFQVYLKVINTYIHISFIPSYTYIYTTYCIRFYIYHIKRELFYFPPSSLFESKKNIFGELWKNRTERRQPAATARLSSSIASVRPPFPLPCTFLFAYVQRVQSILNKKFPIIDDKVKN